MQDLCGESTIAITHAKFVPIFFQCKKSSATRGTAMICPKCGAKNPIGSVYCFNCGGAINAPTPGDAPHERALIKRELELHGLNREQSLLAVWMLLFSPLLRTKIGAAASLEWTHSLIDDFERGDDESFSRRYREMDESTRTIQAEHTKPSIQNPPWSMLSLDLRIAAFPWVSPMFDRFLLMVLSTGSAMEKHFGDVLPFAFIVSGGPGDTPQTAIRICAPSQAVRASAEHWIMRAFLHRREEGSHFNVGQAELGRLISVHNYTATNGEERSIFFDISSSFDHEREDFISLIESRHVLKKCPTCGNPLAEGDCLACKLGL